MSTTKDPCVRIRAAEPEDAPALALLVTELGYPVDGATMASRWPAFVAEGNHALVAVADAGELCGLVTLHSMRVLHRVDPVGRITALVVAEGFRGRGVGRALVAGAERWLSGQGCTLVEVTSNVKRVEAHAFYLRLGFEQTSLRFGKSLRS